MPTPKVKVLLDDGTGTYPYDISTYVDLNTPISITRGKQDEFSEIAASTCSLSLDNTDGRFTPGSATYNIDLGQGIRVGTIVGSTTYWKFTGYVDTWPLEWPNGGKQTYSAITATDRSARFEQANGTFRSPVQETILGDNPDGYYPMTGDEAEAVMSIAATAQPALVVGLDPNNLDDTTFDFGAGKMNPGGYGATVPYFHFDAPDLQTTGLFNTPFRHKNFTFELLFKTANKTPPNTGNINTRGAMLVLQTSRPNSNIIVGLDPYNSDLYVAQYDISTGIIVDDTARVYGFGWDSDMVHIAVTENATGRHLYVNGSEFAASTSTIPKDTYYQAFIGLGWHGSLAHFAFGPALTDVQVARHAGVSLGAPWYYFFDDPDALTTWGGPTQAFDLIKQYATWSGLDWLDDLNIPGLPPDSTFVAPTTLPGYKALEAQKGTAWLTPIDTNGMSFMDAVRTVVDAEDGWFFVDALGKFTFQPRNSRYNSTPALTLPAHKVGEDTRFVLDNQGIVNYATVTTPDGVLTTYSDDTSIGKYGKQQVDLVRNYAQMFPDQDDYGSPIVFPGLVGEPIDPGVFTDDAWLAAQHDVLIHGTARTRISSTSLDVRSFNATDAAAVQALELGDLFSITGLPSQAPSSTVNLFVEGWTENIGVGEWTLTLNTSPAVYYQVATLDDAVYGKLGSYPIAY